MTDDLYALAAQARVAASRGRTLGLPCDEPRRAELKFASQMRAELVERDGKNWYQVEGYASMYERSYEMWDMFGPYREVVSAGAAAKTLAAGPDVVYRFNHAGMPMARTTNGRLELWEDSTGLGDRALLNPNRADVQDLIHAIEGRDVTEQSFMFRINDGTWSPDYSEFRINEFDLERGDVGPVTYGANPNTTVALRSGEILAAIPRLPELAARQAYELLRARSEITGRPASQTESGGRSVVLLSRLLDVD
jgi:Phage head maturation protease